MRWSARGVVGVVGVFLSGLCVFVLVRLAIFACALQVVVVVVEFCLWFVVCLALFFLCLPLLCCRL